MTRTEFHRQIARATGEDLSTICRRGFAPLTRGPVEFEPEDYRPPQTIDWDSTTRDVRSALIDDLFC